MSQRRKKRGRTQPSAGPVKDSGSSGVTWTTAAPRPPHVVELPFSVSDAIAPESTGASDDNGSEARSGYDNSRGNACKSGVRSQYVLPDDLFDLVDTRTREFLEEKAPRTPYERFLVCELACTSVQHEVAGKNLNLDLKRVKDRAAGSGWEADASQRVDRLVVRLPLRPHLVIRQLERTKQGTEHLIKILTELSEVVQSQGRWMTSNAVSCLMSAACRFR